MELKIKYYLTDKFRQYDYGRGGNNDHYGQSTPPLYDLSKVSAKIYLHYSENDWMSHPNVSDNNSNNKTLESESASSAFD